MCKHATFLLFSQTAAHFTYRIDGSNPGIGGTPFTSIQLALHLAKNNPDWQFNIVNCSPIRTAAPPSNLNCITVPGPREYFEVLDACRGAPIIAPVTVLENVPLDLLIPQQSRLIAWSRHPYDYKLRILDGELHLAAAVSVGEYQFYTNTLLRAPSFMINNVFPREPLLQGVERSLPDDAPLMLVHVGALLREKGLLEISQQWQSLKKRLPGVRLNVIGSGDLYRDAELHPVVPTTPDLAEEILGYLSPSDVREGRVVFHGKLGAERAAVLAASHVAIQNPTGASEAFPASVLDCFAAGLPVVASNQYGMWDFMRDFPEGVVRTPDDIPDRVFGIVRDRAVYRELSRRGRAIARRYTDQTPSTVAAWMRLLEAVASNSVEDLKVEGMRPAPRSRFYFVANVLRRHSRIMISHSPAGKLYRGVRGVFAKVHSKQRGASAVH